MQKNERIVTYTDEELREKRDREGTRTNWKMVEGLTQEEIEASIDLEEEGVPDWTTAVPGIPLPKQQITVRLDPDVIVWFKSQGPGYQTRMNAVLRVYMLAHRTG